jgi:hypothetical protein
MLIARTEIERRRAEDSFFAVMEAEEQLLALFMPLNPSGELWDDDAIWRCLTAAIRAMDRLEGAAASGCARRSASTSPVEGRSARAIRSCGGPRPSACEATRRGRASACFLR